VKRGYTKAGIGEDAFVSLRDALKHGLGNIVGTRLRHLHAVQAPRPFCGRQGAISWLHLRLQSCGAIKEIASKMAAEANAGETFAIVEAIHGSPPDAFASLISTGTMRLLPQQRRSLCLPTNRTMQN